MFKENKIVFHENPKSNDDGNNTSSFIDFVNETVETAERLVDTAMNEVGKAVKDGNTETIQTSIAKALSELSKISDPAQKEKFMKDLKDQISMAGATLNEFKGATEAVLDALKKIYKESDVTYILEKGQSCLKQGQPFIVITGYNPNERPLVVCVPS